MTHNDVGFQFPSAGGSAQSSQQNSRFGSPAHGPIPQQANFFQRRYNPYRYAYPAIALGGAALLGATYLGYNRMWKNKAPDPVANTSTPTPKPTPIPTFTPRPKPTPRPARYGSWNITRPERTPERMVWH